MYLAQLLETFFRRFLLISSPGNQPFLRAHLNFLKNSLHNILNEFHNNETNLDLATFKKLVDTVIGYHKQKKISSCKPCPMLKDHGMMYSIALTGYNMNENRSEVVAEILAEIYNCEEGFEKFFEKMMIELELLPEVYELFGDFYFSKFMDDYLITYRLLYFAFHSDAVHQLYMSKHGQLLPFIDVPLRVHKNLTTLVRCAVSYMNSDFLLLLLRHGADPDPREDPDMEPVIYDLLEIIRDRRNYHQFNQRHVKCLRLLLRALSTIPLKILPGCCYADARRELFERFPFLVDQQLVPKSRCGGEPPELKHLCRVAIRKNLKDHFQLPQMIHCLDLPKTLISYLELLDD